MSIYRFSAWTALVILFLLSGEGAHGSLLTNGDLSERSGDFAKGWTVREGGKIEMSKVDGRNSFILETKSESDRLRIFQTVAPTELGKNTRLLLSCLCRSEKPDAYGALLLNVVGPNGRHTVIRVPLVIGSANMWELKSEEVLIAEEIQSAEIIIERKGAIGRIEVGAISLQKVESKDKLTLFSVMRPGIIINGDPRDAIWNALQFATGFIQAGDSKEPKESSGQIQLRSAYTEEALFFRLEMKDAAKATSDSVEVWLGPGGEAGVFWQFVIDREGRVSTYRRTGGRIEAEKVACDVKVSLLPGGWMAELKVLFHSLKTEMPADNARWGFNVARQWKGEEGEQEMSSWARVATFDQRKSFGKLAFYSRDQVDADLAYWEKNDNDPLLRRSSVSGIDIARELEGGESRAASLWSYDAFLIDREAAKQWGALGITDRATAERTGQPKSAEKDYPDFFRAAHRMNLALLHLADAEDWVDSLERTEYYQSANESESVPLMRSIAEIQENLDKAFQTYSAAFQDRWNVALLKGIDEVLESVDGEIAALRERAEAGLKSIQDKQRETKPWRMEDYSVASSEERRDERGAPHRFWFAGVRTYGSGPVAEYFGPFRSVNIEWPNVMAESPAPGVFARPKLDLIRRKMASGSVNFQLVFGQRGYQVPTTSWLEDQIAKDPEILAKTQDSHSIPKTEFAGTGYYIRRGINIEHPAAQKYAEAYISSLISDINKHGKADFVLSGWEESMELNFPDNGQYLKRQRGYDPLSRKAFQDYLKDRYGNIDELKRRWNVSDYRDFSDILPAPDRFMADQRVASGLVYEWNRWQRLTHFRWMRLLRDSVKKGGGNVPVMIDNSSVFMDGNAWEALRQGAADILSFHYNPTNEDAMFAYLGSLARRQGVPLGSFENYSMMYSRLEGEDERLGQLSMRRYYFDMIARDVRIVTPWIGYLRNPTPYAMAYGGGWLRLDNDQTILRWPATEFRIFAERASRIEKALLDSSPVPGRIAVFIPDSSNIQMEYLNGSKKREYLMDTFVKFQNRVLTEKNIPAEYLHEEMLADGMDDLSSYDALFLANAPYIRKDVLERISEWAAKPGKTLFVMGSLGFFDECAQPIPSDLSPLRKTFPGLTPRPDQPWKIAEAFEFSDSMLETASYGAGKLVRFKGSIDEIFARPDQLLALQSAITESVPSLARADRPNIRVHLRKGDRGEYFVLISNRDVRRSQTFSVQIAQRFTDAVDITIPGGFPVKSTETADGTRLACYLAAGDWTMIRLDP